MTYQEKLKDPRWQKKRLKVLERDDWACQVCYDTESTLHVHHKYYEKCDPWEYPDDALTTLCDICHESEKENRPEAEKLLLKAMKEKFFYSDLIGLAGGIHKMPMCHAPDVIASVYEWALSDRKIQIELIRRFLNLTRKKRNAK